MKFSVLCLSIVGAISTSHSGEGVDELAHVETDDVKNYSQVAVESRLRKPTVVESQGEGDVNWMEPRSTYDAASEDVSNFFGALDKVDDGEIVDAEWSWSCVTSGWALACHWCCKQSYCVEHYWLRKCMDDTEITFSTQKMRPNPSSMVVAAPVLNMDEDDYNVVNEVTVNVGTDSSCKTSGWVFKCHKCCRLSYCVEYYWLRKCMTNSEFGEVTTAGRRPKPSSMAVAAPVLNMDAE